MVYQLSLVRGHSCSSSTDGYMPSNLQSTSSSNQQDPNIKRRGRGDYITQAIDQFLGNCNNLLSQPSKVHCTIEIFWESAKRNCRAISRESYDFQRPINAILKRPRSFYASKARPAQVDYRVTSEIIVPEAASQLILTHIIMR